MMGPRPTKLDENGAGADSVLWSLRSPEGTCRTMMRASQTPQNGVCASHDSRIFDTAAFGSWTMEQPQTLGNRSALLLFPVTCNL